MIEPGAGVLPQTHVAKLSLQTVRHPMLRSVRPKPRYGMTLGMADILHSRKVLLLVSGAHKREVLRRLLGSTVTTRFPASFIWLHPDVSIICDREAAAGLRAR